MFRWNIRSNNNILQTAQIMKKVVLGFIAVTFIYTTNVYGQIITDCSDCDKKLLTQKNIEGKSLEELSLLRNEIYARKGYQFNSEQYQRYFENQSWYKSARSNNEVKLSSTETKNVDFLKSCENKIQKRRDAAMKDLKALKKALSENNKAIITKYIPKSRYPYNFDRDDAAPGLGAIFNYLNLDHMHWNKDRAVYSVSIDNGEYTDHYRIYIEGDLITISSSLEANSLIFGDFDDGYSNTHSENESAEIWTFEMQETGIVFKDFQIAG